MNECWLTDAWLLLSSDITDLGLRRSSDGPDTVQSVAGFHSLFLLHLTGANNPIPSTDVKLTVCGEPEEISRRGEVKSEKGIKEGEEWGGKWGGERRTRREKWWRDRWWMLFEGVKDLRWKCGKQTGLEQRALWGDNKQRTMRWIAVRSFTPSVHIGAWTLFHTAQLCPHEGACARSDTETCSGRIQFKDELFKKGKTRRTLRAYLGWGLAVHPRADGNQGLKWIRLWKHVTLNLCSRKPSAENTK